MNVFTSIINLVCNSILIACFANFSVAKAEESQSLFKVADRFFADSMFISAAENYQAFINSNVNSFKEKSGNCSQAYYKIALCYYRTGNFARAAEAFEDFLRLFPADKNVASAFWEAANAYKSHGDFAHASDMFFRFRQMYPSGNTGQNSLLESADCAENAGDSLRAASLYGQYIDKYKSSPDAPSAALSEVRLLIGLRQYAQALNALDKADKKWLRDGPYFPRSLYYRAKLSLVVLKNDTALRLFSALVARTDDFPEKETATEEYCALLSTMREYRTALPVYAAVAKESEKKGKSPSWDFMLSWALCADSAGNLEGAEKLYRRLLAEFPKHDGAAGIGFKIAESQKRRKAYSAALETLLDLANSELEPLVRARAELLLGDLYFDQGSLTDAQTAYHTYCAFPDAEDGDRALFRLAKAFRDSGDFTTAINEFELLARRYPSSGYFYSSALAIAACDEALMDFPAALFQYDVISRSGASFGMVDTAKKRAAYLKKYRNSNLIAAAENMAGLLQKSFDSLPDYERLFAVGDFYENTLDNFQEAMELYERAAACIALGSDSIATAAMLRKAGVYEKIYHKAIYENDGGAASAAKAKALSLYDSARLKTGYPLLADDGEFRKITLGSPTAIDFERYVQKRPKGRHVDEALFLTGQSYENGDAKTGKISNEKALAVYEKIIQGPLGPFTERAYAGKTRACIALLNLDSAQASVREFLRRFPDSTCAVEGQFLSGMIEKKRGNYSGAAEMFKKIIAKRPSVSYIQRARYEMASAELAGEKPQEALRNFRLYVQNFPGGDNYNEARLGEAQCLRRQGKIEDADRLVHDLLKDKYPALLTGALYRELAECSQCKGDVRDAIQNLNRACALDSFPGKTEVCMEMGNIYFENSGYRDAYASYERAVQCASTVADSAEALVGEIKSLILDGQEKKAERPIAFVKDRFGADGPSMAVIAYSKGLRRVVEKDYDKAIGIFKFVSEKFQGALCAEDAAYQVGLCYYYKGKNEKALAVFNEFLARYPESRFVPTAYFKIGMICHDRGDFIQAAQLFERTFGAARADPKTRFRAAYNAALDYQKAFSWLEAARMYRTIVETFPQEVSVSSTYLKIAFCFIQGARFEDAVKQLQKAGSCSPTLLEKPEILYWTAICFEKLGDDQKAIAEFLKVPVFYAKTGEWAVTSQFEAARLYERAGEPKKALDLYKKIVLADAGEIGKEATAHIARLSIMTKEN